MTYLRIVKSWSGSFRFPAAQVLNLWPLLQLYIIYYSLPWWFIKVWILSDTVSRSASSLEGFCSSMYPGLFPKTLLLSDHYISTPSIDFSHNTSFAQILFSCQLYRFNLTPICFSFISVTESSKFPVGTTIGVIFWRGNPLSQPHMRTFIPWYTKHCVTFTLRFDSWIVHIVGTQTPSNQHV